MQITAFVWCSSDFSLNKNALLLRPKYSYKPLPAETLKEGLKSVALSATHIPAVIFVCTSYKEYSGMKTRKKSAHGTLQKRYWNASGVNADEKKSNLKYKRKATILTPHSAKQNFLLLSEIKGNIFQ